MKRHGIMRDNTYQKENYNRQNSRRSKKRKKDEAKEELRCAVVEMGCERNATYLCSRCGRPLCDNEFCRWIIEEDHKESFAPKDNPEEPPSIHNKKTRAYYCLDCLKAKFDFDRKPSFFRSLFNSKLKKIRRKIKRLEKKRKRG